MIGLAIDPGTHFSGFISFSAPGAIATPPFGVLPTITIPPRPDGYSNEEARYILRTPMLDVEGMPWPVFDLLAIEVLPGIYGGTTGSDQIAAERWAGRLIEAFVAMDEDRRPPPRVVEVHRSRARAVVTGNSRANDSQVRAAIIDLYGGQERAFGKRCGRCKGDGVRGVKRTMCGECNGMGWLVPKGPLYGWTGTHLFAALAVAIAAMEPRKE